jgi:hypothetical protein
MVAAPHTINHSKGCTRKKIKIILCIFVTIVFSPLLAYYLVSIHDLFTYGFAEHFVEPLFESLPAVVSYIFCIVAIANDFFVNCKRLIKLILYFAYSVLNIVMFFVPRLLEGTFGSLVFMISMYDTDIERNANISIQFINICEKVTIVMTILYLIVIFFNMFFGFSLFIDNIIRKNSPLKMKNWLILVGGAIIFGTIISSLIMIYAYMSM